jgi:hypothetical protein
LIAYPAAAQAAQGAKIDHCVPDSADCRHTAHQKRQPTQDGLVSTDPSSHTPPNWRGKLSVRNFRQGIILSGLAARRSAAVATPKGAASAAPCLAPPVDPFEVHGPNACSKKRKESFHKIWERRHLAGVFPRESRRRGRRRSQSRHRCMVPRQSDKTRGALVEPPGCCRRRTCWRSVTNPPAARTGELCPLSLKENQRRKIEARGESIDAFYADFPTNDGILWQSQTTTQSLAVRIRVVLRLWHWQCFKE